MAGPSVYEGVRGRLCRSPDVCPRLLFRWSGLLLLVLRSRSVVEGGVDSVKQMLPARRRWVSRRICRPGAGLQDGEIRVEIRIEEVGQRKAVLPGGGAED